MEKTKVVHFKKEEYDVYIGRPSKWGNPFTRISDRNTLAEYVIGPEEDAIEAYRTWLTEGEGQYLLKDIEELRGKKLGCWCSPKRCHGDVLVELLHPVRGIDLGE
jgi:hypothetical protein